MTLELTGISVRFGATKALDDVNLTVEDHEVVAVLGPSGSGKSTLLRVVAGLQQPSSGTVRLNGADVTRTPPHRRGVGLMFQDHVLFPHKNVAGNITFGNRDARVDELLELVGLAGAGNRRIETLSGGEQQRVALARALAPQPSLLMLDEPLGQLDRVLRDRLVVELRRLFVRLRTTVLAVTHDQREAFALADRVVVMNQGVVAQVGTPREVWEQPASEFVARFLGFTNIAPAVVAEGVAETPWGSVGVSAAVAPGRRSVLIRPAGVHVSKHLPDDVRSTAVAPDVVARVSLATFAGEKVELVLSVPGAPPLEAHCPVDSAPVPGDEVVVRLDPGGTVVLPAPTPAG